MDTELQIITKSVLDNQPSDPIQARQRAKARSAFGASAAIAGGTGIGLGIYNRRNPYAVPIAGRAVGDAARRTRTAIVNADERVGRSLLRTGQNIGGWSAEAGRKVGAGADNLGRRISNEGFSNVGRDVARRTRDRIGTSARAGMGSLRTRTSDVLRRAANFIIRSKF